MKRGYGFFTLENRRRLEFLLKEGFSVTDICNQFGITRASIYTELKKGLSEEEYKRKQYIKYTPIEAIESEIKTYIGKDALACIKEKYSNDEGSI